MIFAAELIGLNGIPLIRIIYLCKRIWNYVIEWDKKMDWDMHLL